MKYDIAIDTLVTIQSISWFVVQVIMLFVFVKHGRPVELDAWVILRNKLVAEYMQE